MNGNYTQDLMRAIRGPIVLICIGVLFTVDHFGNLGFDRSWPVVVILIGVLKLAEHLGSRRTDPPYAPAGFPPTENAPPGGVPPGSVQQ